MAHKRIDITNSANMYDILSQTPENYSKNNYFLKELQDKINADWDYRPNRALIEYENNWGNLNYSPIDVVIQTVISEKGTAISEDTVNIVFKNIHEDRFRVGSRFRFSPNYDILDPDNKKDVWIAINTSRTSLTQNYVIQRCNGTLGSSYLDSQGITHYHYEPVIQGADLSATTLFYNETAVSPQSQLLVIAQHNDYTKNYFINQRFIVGYDKVYRIKAINKFYANSTYAFDTGDKGVPYSHKDIGLMRIYLELTESSVYDDFDTRIAYQMTPEIHPTTIGDGNLVIAFSEPEYIPTDLTSTELTFIPFVKNEKTGEAIEDITIYASAELENLPLGVSPDVYFTLTNNGDGSFTLKRNRIYLNGDLKVKFEVQPEYSPTQELISTEFKMVMRRRE